MKIARVKTEKWHNNQEGDCGAPLDRKGKHLCYFKKGWWKRFDRKKFLRRTKKWTE